MLGIRFTKFPPTTYVLHYKNGQVVREGAGLSFFYYAPTSTLVAVPVAGVDLPFVFSEVTRDFQTLTVQGQLAYRVTDPKKLASVLDYSVDAKGASVSDDPESLSERLIAATHAVVSSLTGGMTLKEALVSAARIGEEALPVLALAEAVATLGVSILGLTVLSVRPTPEMAKALEAEAREALQKNADQAIYARRNAAVEEERRIKESELATELSVEEKRRGIREAQMAAEIAVEEKRATLIDKRVKNDRKDADAKGYALEAQLKPLRDMDWRILMAASAGGADPKVLISMAFRDLAENASKIGELNITPDLLKSLISSK